MYKDKWSWSELDYLRKVYPTGGVKAFQKRYERTTCSIWSMARQCGISKVCRVFTSIEIEHLKGCYVRGDISSFVQMYADRTTSSVIAKAIRLNLKSPKRHRWSERSMKAFRESYPKYGWRYFTWRYSNLTKAAVFQQAHRMKLRFEDRGRYIRGGRHYNWKGGKSFKPYSYGFTSRLKLFIKDGYGWACLNCGITDDVRKLHVHHIDYDKTNHAIGNLVPLCNSCHTKSTVCNRELWIHHLRHRQQQFCEQKGLPTFAKGRVDGAFFGVPTRGVQKTLSLGCAGGLDEQMGGSRA